MSALAGAIRGGTVKLLAVASGKSMPQFPDVPTVAETLPGFVATGWFVLLARTATPDPIVQKLNGVLLASLADPGLQKKFVDLGTLAAPMSPEEMQAFIAREEKNWIPVV